MSIHTLIYFLTLILGVVSLLVFYRMLRKSSRELPEEWRKTLPARNFRSGIVLLLVYILIILIVELIAHSLAKHGIYNSFVISIGFTLFTPSLFGFLFIHTRATWKRYSYAILYFILVGYFITGGYYHPKCIHFDVSALVFSSIYFLAALLYLTDLLMNPKTEYFKFQLKVCICILIYNLLGALITSFHWADIPATPFYSSLIYYIYFYNIVFHYLALDIIFMNEIRKLRRS